MNAMYPKGVEAILDGTVDLARDSIRAALLNSSYIYAPEHEATSEIADYSVVALSNAVSDKAFTDGVFSGASVQFTAPPVGHVAASVVLYDDPTGRLLVYFDTGAGLPVTTNGADVTCSWTDEGIFAWQSSS